jgi:hypothetical protein
MHLSLSRQLLLCFSLLSDGFGKLYEGKRYQEFVNCGTRSLGEIAYSGFTGCIDERASIQLL